MSKDFIEIIQDLKCVKKSLDTLHSGLTDLQTNPRATPSEKRMFKELSEFLEINSKTVTESISNVAALAVAHTNIPFDEVIKAVGK